MQKILLVDDREDNLFSIETILEPDGYNFIKANSGRQALKILLKEWDFALILMDVKMPNLNGFETATLIYEREKLKHIPIIFITANNYGDENIFKGYKAGAVDYIYKPINPDLLRAKVSVFIDLYKKNHRLLAQEQKLKAANENLEKQIEERKKSEEEVKNLNIQLMENIQQLKATNEELDHFAFIASHDLQEPLRKIRTFSDMLITKHKDALDDSAGEYLQKIERSSRRMQLLIDDILSFSRFSANDDGFKETDLNDLLEQVLSDLEIVIDEKKAAVNAQSLPVLSVIPSMIRQLLQNLISNALKFSREEGVPKISITCDKIKGKKIPNTPAEIGNNDYYAIKVTDNGIGFEKQYADLIFVIFKRLHSSNSFEGTGIGLAICKKIADKHNGFIYATSTLNEGSEFVLALPAKPERVLSTVVSA
jgi:light-regulated signal transduction histidine kinase (bacteriophytochrome)